VIAAPVATRDAALASVLETLRPDAQRLYGVTALELHVQERISRPFSDIAKVRLDAPVRLPALYVKLARPRRDGDEERAFMTRRVEHDFAITRQIHAAMDHCGEFAVVRPVACYPEHLAIVTEEAPGLTLLAAIERRGRWWQGANEADTLDRGVSRVGQWLDRFQATGPVDGEIAPEGIVEYVDIRLRRLVAHPQAAFAAGDRERILRALDDRLSATSAAALRPVAIHADLALGNVIVSPERVVVLDLAMTGTGNRYHDLAHLFMQLGLMRFKPQFGGGRIAQLQSALLRGYTANPVEREPLFETMLCQHVVCHYLGLVERPASPVSRLYNRIVARGHHEWLQRFADGKGRAATTAAPEPARQDV
jgi:hypothetical protein